MILFNLQHKFRDKSNFMANSLPVSRENTFNCQELLQEVFSQPKITLAFYSLWQISSLYQ